MKCKSKAKLQYGVETQKREKTKEHIICNCSEQVNSHEQTHSWLSPKQVTEDTGRKVEKCFRVRVGAGKRLEGRKKM